MKKLISLSINTVLILALLFSGFPVFHVQDINRDNNVNLKDAILHMKIFADRVEDISSFRERTRNTILTLKQIAGLEASIDKENVKTKFFDMDGGSIAILAENRKTPYQQNWARLIDILELFQASSPLPLLPPPRA
jgi:hypothetical protein